MDSFGSSSIGLQVIIGSLSVTDGFTEFTMTFPQNAFPKGTFTCTVPTLMSPNLNSGCYGALSFIRSGHDYFDNTQIPIYIKRMDRFILNDTAMSIRCAFSVGTPETMSKHTFPIASATSIDAFHAAFKEIGMENVDDRLAIAGAHPVDSMTWRFVNADMTEISTDIVDHSCIPGEYAVWGFNERKNTVFFGGYSAAKTSCTDFMVFSNNAKQSTGNGSAYSAALGKTLWYYDNERRGNIRGDLRDKAFPEVVQSSVNEGVADITSCKSGCFGELASQVGAKPNAEVQAEYGITEGDAGGVKSDVYGDITVVSDFPLNTHKYYPVSPMLRERIASEYSKMMLVDIYNDVGPVVGSSVAVLSLSPDLGTSGPSMDTNYTDRYVVVEKKVESKLTTAGGVLGSKNPTETPNMVTTLTLLSNGKGDPTIAKDLDSLLRSLGKDRLPKGISV